jgi:hypothetical protein
LFVALRGNEVKPRPMSCSPAVSKPYRQIT